MEDPNVPDDDLWLDEEARLKAEELVPEMLRLSTHHTASALKLGTHLFEIRENCVKKRMFGRWCDEFYRHGGIHKRSVQRYIAPAKAFEGDHDTVSVLTLELLGRLSKKTVPQEIRRNVISKLQSRTKDAVAEAISYAEDSLPQKPITATNKNNHPDDASEDDHDEGIPEDADNVNVYPSEAVDNIVMAIKFNLLEKDSDLSRLVNEHGIESLVRLIVRKLKDDQPGPD